MNEFLEKIKEKYLDFIHFKQEQDEEIRKLKEKKRKLESDIETNGMEENKHLDGDYENGIEQREDEIVRINCKISELGIGKEMTKTKEISYGIKMFEIAKYDDKINKLKIEKEKLENEISDIKEGCKTRYKIQIAQNGIRNEIYSVDEEIGRINNQIQKRREPIENILDEKIEIESNVIDKTLKEMERKTNEIEQEELQTQQDIVDLEELDEEEEFIDLKKETIKRLLDEFNEKKSKVEKEYYVLKELYEKHQDDLSKLKKLKQGLYKEEKKVKEEVEKPNNEQKIKVDENNYNERKSEDAKTTKKENFIIKLIRKLANNRRRLKREDEESGWIKTRTGELVPNNAEERSRNSISDEEFIKSVQGSKLNGEKGKFNERMRDWVKPIGNVVDIQLQKENLYKVDEKGRLIQITEEELLDK